MVRDSLTDFAMPDGYKLMTGHFGDDSGVWQGCSGCMIWDINAIYHRHPSRDLSNDQLAVAEAIAKRKRDKKELGIK